jgi:hypothetical protein
MHLQWQSHLLRYQKALRWIPQKIKKNHQKPCSNSCFSGLDMAYFFPEVDDNWDRTQDINHRKKDQSNRKYFFETEHAINISSENLSIWKIRIRNGREISNSKACRF